MALRGSGRVSPQTAQHVRDVAARLGYRADGTARTLREGGTQLIGVLIDGADFFSAAGIRPLFWPIYLEALAREFSVRGAAMVVVDTTAVDRLASVPMNALLVASVNPAGIELPSDLPFGLTVAARASSAHDGVALIQHDFTAMAGDGLAHLLAAGATSIGYLSPPIQFDFAAGFGHAYEQFCELRGQEPFYIDWDCADLAAELGNGYRCGVDAMFSPWGNSRKLLSAASRAGLQVPNDMMLLTVAEGIIESALSPSVSTLSYDATGSAKVTAELVIAGLGAGRIESAILPHTLTARQSTGADPANARPQHAHGANTE